ncbi:trans-sulfuration enzyme family protein [Aminipila terrae]|uniref:Methionine biosynthesis PLP-dependent protein n=1 Tax=Aminipila terrae TaxID=2697030 RepID=A0A6P1MEU8_9FIRM|nr:PLP-dependent aspartate aminotransferase family protein [Aminipila terrae]QHI72341.1 methionine biosynthesis PLP-dependent protein [Aminipila terrae]
MRYESIAVHGGKEEDSGKRAVNYPIYLSSTFAQPGLDQFQEFAYTRGGNPTRSHVERLAADLEGAQYGLALASGMAATSLVFGLLRQGDKVLINNNVYGGTWRYVSNIFSNHGIEYEVVSDFNNYDFSNTASNVKMIFIETPSNPLLEITDIRKVSQEARKRGILTVVDNTFLTSYFQRPMELGADIVVYSATKYYAGHSDILAGLVILNQEELYLKLKFLQNTYGGILSPTDAFLLTRGIKTLSLRLDKHQKNALLAAQYLKRHKAVKDVYYPGLKSHKNYDIQRSQATGDGGVLSLRLNDGWDSKRFTANLKIFDLAVSLGGVESLICHPATMTHESYAPELQEKIGIDSKLLRLSIGIEHEEDILEDISSALKKAKL